MFLNRPRRRFLKKSQYSTVFNNLDSICSCLDVIYDINNGGCCYVAYVIADILHREGIKYEVVVVSSDLSEEFEDLENSAYHVFIKVTWQGKDYLINPGDCSDSKEWQCYENISPEEILYYYKSVQWNCLYAVVKNKFIKYVINLIYDNFSSSLRES